MITLNEVLKARLALVESSKLSLVSNRISILDKIPNTISQKVKILYLSNNDLSKIDQIIQFENCQNLSMGNNLVKFLEDLTCLRHLKHLEKLSLEGNPVTNMPYYREYVLGLCPHLILLDGSKVSIEERLEAKNKNKKIAAVFEQLRINELRLAILTHFIHLSKCHIQLLKLIYGSFK